jgi:hypothetical protein
MCMVSGNSTREARRLFESHEIAAERSTYIEAVVDLNLWGSPSIDVVRYRTTYDISSGRPVIVDRCCCRQVQKDIAGRAAYQRIIAGWTRRMKERRVGHDQAEAWGNGVEIRVAE